MLSQKSLSFAQIILKHNPIAPSNQHNHSQHSHDHSTCSHASPQQVKPYLHVHDHRKCMRAFKQEGNQHFKSKRYQEAAHYYHKMIVYADYTFPEKEKHQKEMEELTQTGNCNLGMSLVKLGQIKKARENLVQSAKGPVQKVIIKSLYWLIKCDMGFGNFEKAEQSIVKLKGFGEGTKNEVNELEIQLKKAVQGYQKKRKAVFGQMFSKQS